MSKFFTTKDGKKLEVKRAISSPGLISYDSYPSSVCACLGSDMPNDARNGESTKGRGFQQVPAPAGPQIARALGLGQGLWDATGRRHSFTESDSDSQLAFGAVARSIHS